MCSFMAMSVFRRKRGLANIITDSPNGDYSDYIRCALTREIS